MKSATLLLCAILCVCAAASFAAVIWLGEKVFETYELRDNEITAARKIALTQAAETQISRAWKQFLEETTALSAKALTEEKLTEIARKHGFAFPKTEISILPASARENPAPEKKFTLRKNGGNIILLREIPDGKIQQIVFEEEALFKSLEQLIAPAFALAEHAKLRFVSVPENAGFGIVRGLPGAKIIIELEPRELADSVAARRAAWLASIGACVMLAVIFALALRVFSLSEKRYLFAASVSHELKTPIAELRACAETAKSRCRDSYLNLDLSAIRHSALELETIVENLLIFSRMRSGNLKLSMTRIPTETLLAPLFERIGDRLISENMDVVFNITPDARERALRTSPEILGRILSNLADNAVKYAYREGAENVLTFNVHVVSNSLIIDVEDEGLGIPDALRSRLFNSFERGSNAGKTNGLGLGLAISSKLARTLNGNLSLLKSDCTGTTFRLEFPI